MLSHTNVINTFVNYRKKSQLNKLYFLRTQLVIISKIINDFNNSTLTNSKNLNPIFLAKII